MNRWVAAVGTGLLAGGGCFVLVAFLRFALWGCDEGPCDPEPAWHRLVTWGVAAIAALAAGWWGARRAERTRQAREHWHRHDTG